MKVNELRWPMPDTLDTKARARIRELRRLVDWHRFSDSEYDFIQKELNILATMLSLTEINRANKNVR